MTETIGEKLRLAREGHNLTFEQVSEATRIRPYYIQALEKDDYSAVPSAAQARGFLRIYATYLGLNVDELLSAARPIEPGPAASPSIVPGPDVSAASVQAAVPAQATEKPRPGFFAGLRERFARRPATQLPESTVTPEHSTTQSEPVPGPQLAPPGPRPVIPVAVKEESPVLQAKPPAAIDKTSNKSAGTAKSVKSRPVSKESASASTPKRKKPVVKLKKSSDDASRAEPVGEKKKITE